jgi:hypothetical protein
VTTYVTIAQGTPAISQSCGVDHTLNHVRYAKLPMSVSVSSPPLLSDSGCDTFIHRAVSYVVMT